MALRSAASRSIRASALLAPTSLLASPSTQHDVLKDDLPRELCGSRFHHTALHACGELHRVALRTAAAQRAQSIAVVPCCYHKLGERSGGDKAPYRPLSKLALTSSRVGPLRRDELQLAVAEPKGAGTARRRDLELREREQVWRLAFDAWQRDAQSSPHGGGGGGGEGETSGRSSGVSSYLSVPSAPERLLRRGSFQDFCEFAVSADGRTADARRRLSPLLFTTATEAGCGRLKPAAYLEKGRERARTVAALELVRLAFRRPLELWLTSDLGLYLEESGYEVEMRALCRRAVTPRNIMLLGRRAEP